MNPGIGWLEPLAALSFVAARTERVRLGLSVLVLPYRNPIIVAEQAATLHLLSGDRLVLGSAPGGCGRSSRRSASTRRSAARGPTRASRSCARCGATTRPRSRVGSSASATSSSACRRASRRRRCGWAGTPARRCAALRHGDGWHGFEVYPEDMPGIRDSLAKLGDEVGRDPGELELSVVRGMVPPELAANTFTPERRNLGDSAEE